MTKAQEKKWIDMVREINEAGRAFVDLLEGSEAYMQKLRLGTPSEEEATRLREKYKEEIEEFETLMKRLTG